MMEKWGWTLPLLLALAIILAFAGYMAKVDKEHQHRMAQEGYSYVSRSYVKLPPFEIEEEGSK